MTIKFLRDIDSIAAIDVFPVTVKHFLLARSLFKDCSTLFCLHWKMKGHWPHVNLVEHKHSFSISRPNGCSSPYLYCQW